MKVMGISHPIISLILDEGKEHPFSGSILQLGKQKILCDAQGLEAIAEKTNYPLKMVDSPANAKINEKPSGKSSHISDNSFFKSLGFSEVHALDVSDYEGANLIFDLNKRKIPNELEERFDVIINGGTIEHVFHLPHALQNIFHMLKVGGRVIHIAPANNYLDHGFYLFSPCFFIDYYRANQFKIIRSLLLRSHANQTNLQGEVAECSPGSPVTRILNRVGALDNRMYNIFFVAEKTSESQSEVIPQQSSYLNIWESYSQIKASNLKEGNLFKTLYHLLRKLPGMGEWFTSLAYRIYSWQSISWKRIP
jgi:hypothetical protein